MPYVVYPNDTEDEWKKPKATNGSHQISVSPILPGTGSDSEDSGMSSDMSSPMI